MATSRNFKNLSATTTPAKMAAKYTNMLNAVSNMLSKEGPIYSTWIRFQIGKSNPIIFDSTSNNKKENMIAGLTFNKKGAGVVNDFELTIKYDPFDYGQNTTDKIELLDELIATAMSYDMDNDMNRMRGYLQYGYNNPSDDTLISPKYQFILTNAESSVDWSTGIAEYVFEGTTDLAADANFVTAIPEFQDKNLIDVVATVLWAFYGKEAEKPTHTVEGLDFHKNEWGYSIEVDGSLRNDAPIISSGAASKQSPWLYVRNLLDSNMSKTDSELEVYQSDKITQSQRPRYTIFITDEAGSQTIHLGYVSPKEQGKNVTINYDFTWGLQSQKNLVVKWSPEIDLRLYLLQQAVKKRNDALLTDDKNKARSDQFMDLMNSSYLENADVYEMYDATLSLIGIPADIPLCAEVTIKPRLLETVSRTAGIYMIQGGTDRIATNGTFISELKLLRIRGITDPPISRKKAEAKTTSKDTSSVTSATSKTNTDEETLKKIAEDFNSKSNTSKAVVVNGEIKFTQGVWPVKNNTNSTTPAYRTVQQTDYSKLNIQLVQNKK